MSVTAPASSLRPLAVREIKNYATSWLFLLGAAATALLTVMTALNDDGTSSTMDMIVPAALIGLVGLIVMSMLTARSDRAAAAAGTTAVGQRTRTLALLAATVVPFTTALLWFIAAVVILQVQPPADWAAPFGPVTEGDVITVYFALGVVSAVGGPLLGLLTARWLPWRGSAALVVVGVVIVTILMQGNFSSTWTWRVVWPWTYWFGTLGWNDSEDWIALPGSPAWWLVYLVALCVIGALVALYRDPEANRARLRWALVVMVLIAAAALVATMTTGLPDMVVNPVPAPVAE